METVIKLSKEEVKQAILDYIACNNGMDEDEKVKATIPGLEIEFLEVKFIRRESGGCFPNV